MVVDLIYLNPSRHSGARQVLFMERDCTALPVNTILLSLTNHYIQCDLKGELIIKN